MLRHAGLAEKRHSAQAIAEFRELSIEDGSTCGRALRAGERNLGH
jgi:hypothetical protein